MNKIIFLHHDRPQRIGYRNDVLFGATVYKGSKKRSRKKVNAGELYDLIYIRFSSYISALNCECSISVFAFSI